MGVVLAALSGGTGRYEGFGIKRISLRGVSFSLPQELAAQLCDRFLGGGDEAAERHTHITA